MGNETFPGDGGQKTFTCKAGMKKTAKERNEIPGGPPKSGKVSDFISWLADIFILQFLCPTIK